jgi:hypothetical protein
MRRVVVSSVVEGFRMVRLRIHRLVIEVNVEAMVAAMTARTRDCMADECRPYSCVVGEEQ